MKRLEETILFILDYARNHSINSLSRMQIHKLVYLIEVEAHKFIGDSFIDGLNFHRDTNGPLSNQIYDAISELTDKGYVEVTEIPNESYGHPRADHRLKKDISNLSFTRGEIIFLNSVLSDYIQLSQKKLKEVAYSTIPMTNIINEEEKVKLPIIGRKIDFNSIPLDEDIISAISV